MAIIIIDNNKIVYNNAVTNRAFESLYLAGAPNKEISMFDVDRDKKYANFKKRYLLERSISF